MTKADKIYESYKHHPSITSIAMEFNVTEEKVKQIVKKKKIEEEKTNERN